MSNFGQSFCYTKKNVKVGENLLLLIWEQTQQENNDLRAVLSHCLFYDYTHMQVLPSVTGLRFIKTPEAAVNLISTAVIRFWKQ